MVSTTWMGWTTNRTNGSKSAIKRSLFHFDCDRISKHQQMSSSLTSICGSSITLQNNTPSFEFRVLAIDQQANLKPCDFQVVQHLRDGGVELCRAPVSRKDLWNGFPFSGNESFHLSCSGINVSKMHGDFLRSARKSSNTSSRDFKRTTYLWRWAFDWLTPIQEYSRIGVNLFSQQPLSWIFARTETPIWLREQDILIRISLIDHSSYWIRFPTVDYTHWWG